MGNALRSFRSSKGWSQHVLAAKLGTYQSAISQYEQGAHCVPNSQIEILRKLGFPVTEAMLECNRNRPTTIPRKANYAVRRVYKSGIDPAGIDLQKEGSQRKRLVITFGQGVASHIQHLEGHKDLRCTLQEASPGGPLTLFFAFNQGAVLAVTRPDGAMTVRITHGAFRELLAHTILKLPTSHVLLEAVTLDSGVSGVRVVINVPTSGWAQPATPSLAATPAGTRTSSPIPRPQNGERVARFAAYTVLLRRKFELASVGDQVALLTDMEQLIVPVPPPS